MQFKRVITLLMLFTMVFTTIAFSGGSLEQVSAAPPKTKVFKSLDRGNWKRDGGREANIAYVGQTVTSRPSIVGTTYKTDDKGMTVYCLNWDKGSPKLTGNKYNLSSDSVSRLEYLVLHYGYRGPADRTAGKGYTTDQRYYITQLALYSITNDKGTPSNMRLRTSKIEPRPRPQRGVPEALTKKITNEIKSFVNYIENSKTAKPSENVKLNLITNTNNKFVLKDGYLITSHASRIDVSNVRRDTKTGNYSITLDSDKLSPARFVDKNGNSMSTRDVRNGKPFYLRINLKDIDKAKGTVSFKATGNIPYKVIRKYVPAPGERSTAGGELQRMLWMHEEIGKASATFSLNYEKPTGSIKITKQDKDTGVKLQGAKYRLHDSSGKVVSVGGKNVFTTGSDGTVTITGLNAGTYRVTEIEAPDRYYLDWGPVNVTVGAGKTVNLTARNTFVPEIPVTNKKIIGNITQRVVYNEQIIYSVDVDIPNNIQGYTHLGIKDTLHKDLIYHKSEVYVDGKLSSYKPTVSGRDVNLTISKTQLESLKGKTVGLRIYTSTNKSEQIIPNTALVTYGQGPLQVESERVNLKVELVELGFNRIKIDTAKVSEGLPVEIDFNVNKYENKYKDRKFTVGLYDQKTGEKVATKEIKLGEVVHGQTVQLEVPKKYLEDNVGENDMRIYEVRIDSYDEDAIKLLNNANKINTEGYTSVEDDVVVDIKGKNRYDLTKFKLVGSNDVKISGDTLIYKGVISTERYIGKNITRQFEEVNMGLEKLRPQKSGYGVEVERTIKYSNDKGNTENVLAGLFIDEELHEGDINKQGNSKYLENEYYKFDVDEYGYEEGYFLSGETNAKGYVRVLMERSTTKETGKENMMVFNYKMPKIYVEYKTGNLFADNTHHKIKHGTRDGGNKLYIPIWVSDIGEYDVNFKTLEPVGVHEVTFDVRDTLDVYAYMYAHIDDKTRKASKTIKQDEILLRPGNLKSNEKLRGWTESDLNWLKY